jgi:hypothetical protein
MKPLRCVRWGFELQYRGDGVSWHSPVKDIQSAGIHFSAHQAINAKTNQASGGDDPPAWLNFHTFNKLFRAPH